mgnify:CR=1 FL=1
MDYANRRQGITIVIVLCLAIGLALVSVAAFTFFQSQSRGFQQGVFALRARYLANAGFNLAAGKLLQISMTLKDRWYASEGDSCSFAQTLDGGNFDVFVCDVFNRGEELDKVFVVSRGSFGTRNLVHSLAFGAMKAVPRKDGPFAASIISKEWLNAKEFLALYDDDPSRYNAEATAAVNSGAIGLTEGQFMAARPAVVQLLRSNKVGSFDFSDENQMKTLVALFIRHLEIRATIQLANAVASLNRRARLDAILQNAAGVHLDEEDVIEILSSVYNNGPVLSGSTCADVLNKLTRPQIELMIVYIILQRIAALPPKVEIEMRGVRMTPPKMALAIARLLYTSIMAKPCDFPTIAGVIHVLLRQQTKLTRTNVLQHFFYILDEKAVFWWTGGLSGGLPGPKDSQPLRKGALELARRFPQAERGRFPFSRHAVDTLRDGKTGLEMLGGNYKATPFWFQRLLSSVPPRSVQAEAEFLLQLRSSIDLYLADALAESGEEGLRESVKEAASIGLGPAQEYALIDSVDDLFDGTDTDMITLELPLPGGTGTNPDLGDLPEIWADNEVQGTKISQAQYDELMNEDKPGFVQNENPVGDLASAQEPPAQGNEPWTGHPMLDSDGYGTDDEQLPQPNGAPPADLGYVGNNVEPPMVVDGDGQRVDRPPLGGLPGDNVDNPNPPANPGAGDPNPTDPGTGDPNPPDPGLPPVQLPPIPTNFDPMSISNWLDAFRELGRQRPAPPGCSGPDAYVTGTLNVDQGDWAPYQGLPFMGMAWQAVLEGSAEAQ